MIFLSQTFISKFKVPTNTTNTDRIITIYQIYQPAFFNKKTLIGKKRMKSEQKREK